MTSEAEQVDAAESTATVATAADDPGLEQRIKDSAKRFLPLLNDKQLESLWFMYKQYREGCINANHAGTGKCIQTIALIRVLMNEGLGRKFLILCPSHLANHWRKEFIKWTGSRNVVRGNHPKVDVVFSHLSERSEDHVSQLLVYEESENSVMVLDYTRFRKWMRSPPAKVPGTHPALVAGSDALMKNLLSPHLLVCDEAHMLLDDEGFDANLLRDFAAETGRVLLTGSPLVNSIEDLYNFARLARRNHDPDSPFALCTASEFNTKFIQPCCRAYNAGNRTLALEIARSLREAWEKFAVRLEPDLDQMPQMLEIISFCLPTQQMIDARRQFWEFDSTDREIPSEEYSRERMISASHLLLELPSRCDRAKIIKKLANVPPTPKVRRILQLIEDEPDSKWLVFSASVKSLYAVAYYLCCRNLVESVDFGIHAGKANREDRERILMGMNDSGSRMRVMLATTASAGTGLNVTGANNVILLDVGWNSTSDMQAIARIHRRGQTRITTAFHMVHCTTAMSDTYVLRRQLLRRILIAMILDDEYLTLAHDLGITEDEVAHMRENVNFNWVDVPLNDVLLREPGNTVSTSEDSEQPRVSR